MAQHPFYITTTIPYVNAKPHIGFALEIVQADVLARFHQLLGSEVFFNAGTDEHGQKIYQKALEEKKDPQDYVDEYAAQFDNLKQVLHLSYNNFIRTTDLHHKAAAQEFWRRCDKNGDIYKDKQKNKYCVGCELEKTDSELNRQGRCPLHPNQEIEVIEEENYFFRFSRYQKSLLEFYEAHPDFVIPKYRFKEIKQFVTAGLKDFSVSRLKDKMPWGIDVPDDSDHVMYVWFDALVNYISALGWPDKQDKFAKFWGTKEKPNAVQVAGKDNLRQQTAIWQAMLMSAGLPNTKQILIHGFITSGGQKMSKSLGNVIDPFEVVNKYGTDPVRYYLLKEIHPFKDGDFSYERFEEIYNADLANGLGNLVQRVAKLCEKNGMKGADFNQTLSFDQRAISAFANYEFHLALDFIWQHIKLADQFIDKDKPWEKDGEEALNSLESAVNDLMRISYNLKPFLPETAQKIESVFTAQRIKAPEKPLFPRV
jgi:methionyl-tRNA synthetase